MTPAPVEMNYLPAVYKLLQARFALDTEEG